MSQYSNKREKTRQHIFATYGALLKKHTVAQITVKDVCTSAGINRSTFYTYFHDVFDLEESLEDDILDRASSSIEGLILKLDDINAGIIIPILTDIIRENDNLPLYIIKNGQSAFADKLVHTMMNYMAKAGIPIDRSHSDEILIYMKYHLSGVTSMIADWESHHQGEEIDLLIQRVARAATEGPITVVKELL